MFITVTTTDGKESTMAALSSSLHFFSPVKYFTFKSYRIDGLYFSRNSHFLALKSMVIDFYAEN